MPETPPCDACGGPSAGLWGSCDGVHVRFCEACYQDPVSKVASAIRSRRAAKAGSEMYGTMPDVLPETLPDGTLCSQGWRHYGLRNTSADGWQGYDFDRAESPYGGLLDKSCIEADSIDWHSVPKQPAADRPANETPAPKAEPCGCDGIESNGCGACKPRAAENSGRSDPYADDGRRPAERDIAACTAERNESNRRHRIRTPAASEPPANGFCHIKPGPDGTLPRIGIEVNAVQRRLDADASALDRLAAARARRAEPPRPEPERARHPGDWDCWATPTWETD